MTVLVWGPPGSSVEEQGFHDVASDYGGLGALGLKGLETKH